MWVSERERGYISKYQTYYLCKLESQRWWKLINVRKEDKNKWWQRQTGEREKHERKKERGKRDITNVTFKSEEFFSNAFILTIFDKII